MDFKVAIPGVAFQASGKIHHHILALGLLDRDGEGISLGDDPEFVSIPKGSIGSSQKLGDRPPIPGKC
jgi:hypothetical protein